MGGDVAIRGVSGVLARAADDRTGLAGLGVTAGAWALAALVAWVLGVVPQILFRAVVGASSYALIRWNVELERALPPLLCVEYR